ncbi:hypothetical protein [Thermomonas brevis]|jgi:hypothetical protein
MNRKLHNSLTAAMACSTLLVVALLFGAPAEPFAAMAPGVAANAAGPADAVVTAAHAERPVARRSYQSVRMPFFSFFNPQG